jgi:hypothetical protein
MPLEIELQDASGRLIDRIRKRASGDIESCPPEQSGGDACVDLGADSCDDPSAD